MLPSRSVLRSLSLVVLGLGCQAESPAGQTAAGAEPAKPDAAKPDAAKPDAAKPDAAKPDAAKPDAAKPDAKQRIRDSAATSREADAKFIVLLDEGRAASKAKDYPLAMTKLAAALAIRPGHGAALGELGWAAFNAGKLDDAESYTRKAMLDATENGRRGALLYNLGRIHEARGLTAKAIEQYETSLAVRPNPTVEQRLAELRAAPPEASPAAVAGSASAQALCDPPSPDDDLGLTCTCEVVDSKTGEGQGWTEVALLVTACEGDWSSRTHELVVLESTGWRSLGAFMTEYGGGTDHGEGEATLEFVELDPSVGLEVRITTQYQDWASNGYNDELDAREFAVAEQNTQIVCGAADGGWCVTLPTLLSDTTFLFGDNGVDVPNEGKPSFEASLSFDGLGSVTFTTTDPAWQGTKRLREIEPVDRFPAFVP